MAYDELYEDEVEMTEDEYWHAFFLTKESENVLKTHKRLQEAKERKQEEQS